MIVLVEEPTTVFPLYVVHVRVQVPVDAFGISEANDNGGVHDTESDDVFVAIVPDAVPNVYVIVTERDECGLVRLIVNAVPIVPDTAEDL